MNTLKLSQQFGKKNIPDIRPGDTVKVYFKITEGGKTRIQIFEGICLALKHGKGLDGTMKLRKISGGIGVERTFPLHSPLISKFEKVKSVDVRRAKLYFLRDLVGKKKKKKVETKSYEMWEEAVSEEELAKIDEEKQKAAAEKKAKKEQEKAELDKKFEQAVASHKTEEKSEARNPKSETNSK